MELLKLCKSFVALVFLSTPLAFSKTRLTYAEEFRKEIDQASKNLCRSTEEYIKALKFLRSSREITFNEQAARKIADQVSKSCDGGTERFAQILMMIKGVGFSERKSLQMALEFAMVSSDVQKTFLEVYTKAYLAEFFDYEYGRAMQLAFDLSRDYKGDPAKARTDFITLVRFCKDSTKLDLPMRFCAEYAEKIAKLSQFYIDGVSVPFMKLYNELRDKKDFNMDVKAALQLSHDILSHGPLAPKNFYEAYTFAGKDLELDRKAAVEFAVRMAERSHTGDKPPVLHFRAPPPLTATP